MNEKKDETIPSEEIVDSPRRHNAEHKTLLKGLKPRHWGETQPQLAPSDHSLLPRRHRVVGCVLRRWLVRQLDEPITLINHSLDAIFLYNFAK